METRKRSTPESKGGRPRKELSKREELWRAQRAARLILEAFEPELPVAASRLLIDAKTKVSRDDISLMTKCFPLAVDTSAKSHTWNLEVLSSILLWDDPVLLLQRLLEFEPERLDSIEALEKKPCSSVKEKLLRERVHLLWQNGMVLSDDRMIGVHFPRFQENMRLRKQLLK